MVAATIECILITLAGSTLLAAPGLLGAASRTVDVAAIAAGADQHLVAAARTEIEARSCMRLFSLSTEP